jgi:hypothetical protein
MLLGFASISPFRSTTLYARYYACVMKTVAGHELDAPALNTATQLSREVAMPEPHSTPPVASGKAVKPSKPNPNFPLYDHADGV